jgi:indole-3-pyruvate monooxygenase
MPDNLLNHETNEYPHNRMKSDKQKYFGKDGLYSCGFWIGPTGVIREISLDAQKIAKHIAGTLSPVIG